MDAPKPVSAIPARAIVFLSFAAFASQAMVRVVDPLLPQIAADVGTTIGTASVVTTAPTTLAVMSPASFAAMRREMAEVALRIDDAIRERLER